jgi:hypothetical protein
MAKTKEAKVDIQLPDGTKISARGPIAEQLAWRLMDRQWRYYWPTWYGNAIAPLTGTYSVTNASGSVVSQDPNSLADTVTAGLGFGLAGTGNGHA